MSLKQAAILDSCFAPETPQSSTTNNFDDSKKIGYDHDRSKILLQTAWRNFQRGRYTDVTVTVDKRKFNVHRLVLVSLCDFFTPLFKIDEKGSGEVILKNISPDDFEILLKYAYTGQVDITLENVQSVLIAADYLSVEFVKNECVNYMKSHLDVDNVCDALIFGTNYIFADLKHSALEFMKQHLDNVSRTESFLQLDPEYLFRILEDDNLILFENNKFLQRIERESLVFKSVLRYLSLRKESNLHVIELLLTAVRLPELSNDIIKKCLKEFKELSKNEAVKKFIKLNELAVKCIDKRKRDNSLLSELAAKARDVPESWFRPRKLSYFIIHNSHGRYSSTGGVKSCVNPPTVFINDPCFEIHSIDVWIRLWDQRHIISGLRVVYRRGYSQGKTVEYFKGSHLNSIQHHFIEFQPHELITKVSIGSGWLIDRLGFETNLGNMYGPFGGPGGSQYEEVVPSPTFSYLFDISCDSVKTQGSDAILNLMLRWIEFR